MLVMLASLVSSLIVIAMVQSLLRQQRQTLVLRQQAQAHWLAEAGAQLARRQWQQNPDYAGENWIWQTDRTAREDANADNDADAAIPTGQQGRVSITREPATETHSETPSDQLVVVAEYPLDGPQRVRTRRVITLTSPFPQPASALIPENR